MTKKISWRVGDVIEYGDRAPRVEIGKIVGTVEPDDRNDKWRPDFEPMLLVKRLRDNETIQLLPSAIDGRADVIAATAAMAQTPLSMRFRHQTLGEHVHVDVFTGPPGATLANSGKLVFRAEGWISFVLALTSLGSMLPSFDVSFVERE